MNTLIKNLKMIIKKLKISKINFLNYKFKKYIVKYEEIDGKLRIFNSDGYYKLVDNTIPNKVKTMEIIKAHEKEINKKIEYYNNKKDDDKIIILSSSLILIVLGFLFVLGFFFGSYELLIISLISFSIALYLYILNTYKIWIFRTEIKRLNYVKENKLFNEEDEILGLIKDSFVVMKNKFYEIILKVISLFEKKSKIS